MSDNSLLYKIAINHIPGIGIINAKKIISQLGSVEAVFRERKSTLLKVGGIGKALVEKIINNKALKKAGKKPLKKVCKNCVLTKKQLKNRKKNI